MSKEFDFGVGDKVQIAKITQPVVNFYSDDTCWINEHTLLLMKKLGKCGIIVDAYAGLLKVRFDDNPADFFHFQAKELRHA